MKSYSIDLFSSLKLELINITPEVVRLSSSLGLDSALMVITTPHTTAAIIMSEDDPELCQDIINVAERLLDIPNLTYKHNRNNNPNAKAHIMGALFGNTILVPIVQGQVLLGDYQNVVFVELDGPRKRTVKFFIYD